MRSSPWTVPLLMFAALATLGLGLACSAPSDPSASPGPPSPSESMEDQPIAKGPAPYVSARTRELGRTRSGLAGRPTAANGTLGNQWEMGEMEDLNLEEADELLLIQESSPSSGSSHRFRLLGKGSGMRGARASRHADAVRRQPAKGGRGLVPQGFQAQQGSLLARDPSGETIGEFPLEHTDVKAEVSGFLASTLVRQTFTNTYREPIEAVYVFPLPARAAINDFLMQIGDRKIVGLIRPREEAERIYAEARARGQTASLLTQERPNIFTQNVANIEPGGKVVIHITYFHTLRYEKGRYEYTFPMVVGPRYIPGNRKAPAVALAGAAAQGPEPVGGGGTATGTDQVPDASRISPPVLREGERSGHDISVLIDIDAGVLLGKLEVLTHDVHIERAGPTRAIVRLADADSIPNRDFVLRYDVSGEAPAAGLLSHRDERTGGFFTLMLVPQLDPRDADVTPREVTFVMDTSGSMRGIPMEMSKEVVRRTLRSLRPDDRFNIIRFAGDSGMLSSRPLENSDDNIRRGLEYVDAMRGSGGTEMMKGIRAYLSTGRDPAFIRIVCFLTDGYVGNEAGIIKMIRDEGQDARWFSFGIGSSVNRYLIQGIATEGNGASHIVLPRDADHAERAVESFLGRIDAPVLVDIELDFGGLPIADVYPEKVSDLFTGQPIVLCGRYMGEAEGTITIRGRVGVRDVAIPVAVSFPEEEARNSALGPVWARQRIADLSRALLDKPGDEEVIAAITGLALEFRLVSAYTAFLAVDESRIVGDGRPLKVLVPVEIPESVSRDGAVGREPVGEAVQVVAWGITLMEHADGSVRVVAVSDKGTAEGKIRKGERLASVGRTEVRGLRHLEALLLQAAGDPIEIGLRAGDDAKGLISSVWLPRP